MTLPLLRDEHFELLELVRGGPHALALAVGNTKQANTVRQELAIVAESRQ